jgi:acyl-CoA hydrolase
VTKVVTLERLVSELGPGQRIYLPGSAGEPIGLVGAFLEDAERTRNLDLTTTAIPGINPLSLDRLHDTARVTGLFMQPAFKAAQRSGQFRHLPVPYSGFARHLHESPVFDTCIVHVSPPDARGLCSLGPAVEFTPIAIGRARRIVAIVNLQLPAIPGAEAVAFDRIDLAAEIDEPLRDYDAGRSNEESTRIASRIAGFVEDGATLQVGLGKVPNALFSLLHDRRGLRLHSGMLSDGVIALSAAGALDPSFPPTSCVWVGTRRLYEWLRGRDGISVLDCERTHGARALGALDRFIAVNSALSVDLFGQCNLEIAAGATVSGVGGAPDFARAARHSKGGISIIALPSSYGGGMKSRIVPRFGDEMVSLARTDVDVICTEHGAADLRGKSVHERAEALIAIAAPQHRAVLEAAWREMAGRI